MEEKEKLKLRKLLRELKEIKGRHTELVSVYVPAGFNLVEIINQLIQEKSTAMNIKSKTTRKNVLDALEKIITHLRLFKQTPPNGLIVFCGNVSKEEGKSDIKLWSIEPPEKLNQKLYWCDQIFVLEPLEEMVKEKEIYGLIVLDARNATIGLLEGKTIKPLKFLESTVPSKSVKGGMCVSEDSLIQLENGDIIPIKNLSNGKNILSYSFKDFTPLFTHSFEIFKRKNVKECYELIFKEPSVSITLTPEHLVFVVSENGIIEKSVKDLKIGEMALFLSQINVKSGNNKKIGRKLAQFLGYFLGDGTVDNNRIILYDKDLEILNKYAKLGEKIVKKKPITLKRRKSYELRFYSKSFVEFVLSNFPLISKARKEKDIDSEILRLPNKKLKYFIKGLFDAEGYTDKDSIGLRITNEKIIKKLQLLLLRFNIVSSVRGSDKFGRYELRITNPIYIKNFRRKIGFSSSKKLKKLDKIVRKYKMGFATRIPLSGKFVRKLIEKVGLKKENFKRYGMFLVEKRNIGYPIFKKLVRSIEIKTKDKEIIDFLKKILASKIIGITLKEKRKIHTEKEFYDLYVPKFNSFVANGIILHNSQRRYDRIREDAINEFLTKVGEIASKFFLEQKNLKGVIVGGPGYLKETFLKEDYLHYQIRNKVLGMKDTSYVDEYGLEELVNRAQDLLKEASVAKEKALLNKFFFELQKSGKVSYKIEEIGEALSVGAVDILLISDAFDLVKAKLSCECGGKEVRIERSLVTKQVCEKCGKEMKVEEIKEITDEFVDIAKKFGTKVEFISTDTREGIQFKELSGIGAFLRYKLT